MTPTPAGRHTADDAAAESTETHVSSAGLAETHVSAADLAAFVRSVDIRQNA